MPQLRADLRAASARLLCRAGRQARAAPARDRHPARQAVASCERCGVDQAVVLRFDERLPRSRRRPSSTTCWCAAWARATCWWATTSASAPSAPATTRCSTPPARAGLRRGAHDELRGARPARVELGRARSAGRRRHAAQRRAAGPALQHQRPRGARPQARARTGLSHAEPALRPRKARGAAASSSCACTAWPRTPLPGVASLGVRPTVEDAGRQCCSRCIAWNGPKPWAAEGGYGRCIRVELLHKLHDERQYRRWRRCATASPRTWPTRAGGCTGRRPDATDADWHAATARCAAPAPDRSTRGQQFMPASAAHVGLALPAAGRPHQATHRQTTRDRI